MHMSRRLNCTLFSSNSLSDLDLHSKPTGAMFSFLHLLKEDSHVLKVSDCFKHGIPY